jgi:hypothetical protein
MPKKKQEMEQLKFKMIAVGDPVPRGVGIHGNVYGLTEAGGVFVFDWKMDHWVPLPMMTPKREAQPIQVTPIVFGEKKREPDSRT